jgi:peroxiredoxin
MRKKAGERAPEIELPAIDGTVFNTERVRGKPYMLSFFRFASCPFCNLRVHELSRRFSEFGDDFQIVAVFDSPIANLVLHARGHNAPFPILADQENRYYNKYGIERSLSGVIKGMVFRMPTLIKGMGKGYIPTRIKGNITTMPADFLIDKNGVIQKAYYGRDEGDHLSIDEIKTFALNQETGEENVQAACACM